MRLSQYHRQKTECRLTLRGTISRLKSEIALRLHPGIENKHVFFPDQVYEVLHILQDLLHPPLTLLHNLQEVPVV